MRKSRIFFVLGASVLAAGGIFVSGLVGDKGEIGQVEKPLPAITEAYNKIVEKSVFRPKSEQLVEGAIRGMAEAISDPYSTYYTKEEAVQHRQALAEERVGIGVEIMYTGNRFVVVSPMKDSPAERAGIRPYDELVQVGDVRLDNHTMADLLALLRGEANTEVTLVVYRPSVDRHLQMTLERKQIKNDTVASKVVEQDHVKVGIISISMFGEKTAEEWVAETEKVLKQGVQGIVVDVRGNPGGYLHSVAALASTVVKNGEIFAYMQNAEGALQPLKTEKVNVSDEYIKAMRSISLVLLQNEGSASASEVLSGALKTWKRATIVGVTSFGKGTVQDTWSLVNGGELKLTTNKWLTPKREWIHKKGIEADLVVEQNELFLLEMQPLRGEFKKGQMGEEIAYVQKVLEKLGFMVERTDGYFDSATETAIEQFRKQQGLPNGKQLDTLFFTSLHEYILKYKEDAQNDTQLQMGVSVLLHEIEAQIK